MKGLTQLAKWAEVTQAKEQCVPRLLMCMGIRAAAGRPGRLGPRRRHVSGADR